MTLTSREVQVRVESQRVRAAVESAVESSDVVVLALRSPGGGETQVRVGRGDFNLLLSNAGRGQWARCSATEVPAQPESAA